MHRIWLIVFALWTLGEILLLLRTRIRAAENAQPGRNWDRGTLRILWLTIFLSITAGQFARGLLGATPLLTHAPVLAWIRVGSLVLLILGAGLRLIAIRTLGRAFSVNVAVRADQRVVQHGLYAWVRHPSYTALVILFVAIGAETASVAAWIVTLVPPTLALLWRIHVEEIALPSRIQLLQDLGFECAQLPVSDDEKVSAAAGRVEEA